MRLIVILLSTLLLFSCEPANFWQKADIAKKEPLRLEPSLLEVEEKEGKVDVMSTFKAGDSSRIEFLIDKPESLENMILRRQSRSEIENMAEVLSARCYTKEEIKAFLGSGINDENVLVALRNTVALLEHGESTVSSTLKGISPDFEHKEGESEEEKALIDAFISLRATLIEDTIVLVFSPLDSILDPTKNPTWGDYVRCILAVDLLGGTMEGIEGLVVAVDESEVLSIDLSASQKEIEDMLSKRGAEALTTGLRRIVSSLLSPLAVYNNIAYSYGDAIGMESCDKLIEKIAGGDLQ